MEQSGVLVQNYLYGFAVLLLILIAISFKMIVSQKQKMQELQSKYDNFTQGDNKNWDEVLTTTLNEVHVINNELEKAKQRENELRKQLSICLQHLQIVRYDAFSDTGGGQSYSLALLDEHHNGIIMTSIYGREDSRTYAKPIENGVSKYPLSKEEQLVLKKALEG